MSIFLAHKLLLLPIKRIGGNKDGQLQQVRHHAPITGPPRWRIASGQKLILGWGSLLVMMIIPFWALFQMPRWSKLHNGIPLDDDGDAEVDDAENK